jgi:hypothetical protein
MVIKMCKKILIFSLACAFCFLCGCSKESKFGVEQFSYRMNSQFEYGFDTKQFILGIDENNENNLFYERDSSLITLSLDNNNNIIGISLLETDTQKASETIRLFSHMCSVFTGNDYETQCTIFEDYKINEETIKVADNNTVITVGKYKYTIICNEFSITLFCDKL